MNSVKKKKKEKRREKKEKKKKEEVTEKCEILDLMYGQLAGKGGCSLDEWNTWKLIN